LQIFSGFSSIHLSLTQNQPESCPRETDLRQSGERSIVSDFCGVILVKVMPTDAEWFSPIKDPSIPSSVILVEAIARSEMICFKTIADFFESLIHFY
jgi:hypothetical protein